MKKQRQVGWKTLYFQPVQRTQAFTFSLSARASLHLSIPMAQRLGWRRKPWTQWMPPCNDSLQSEQHLFPPSRTSGHWTPVTSGCRTKAVGRYRSSEKFWAMPGTGQGLTSGPGNERNSQAEGLLAFLLQLECNPSTSFTPFCLQCGRNAPKKCPFLSIAYKET